MSLIAMLNIFLIALGTAAAAADHWWAAAGMWVFVIADILDDIAVAARAARRADDGR